MKIHHLRNIPGIKAICACSSCLLLSLVSSVSFGQNCNLTLKGKVVDEHDDKPLEYAIIKIEESEETVVANKEGEFTLSNLCPGHLDLIISHLNCDAKQVGINLHQDTFVTLYLEHHEIIYNPTVFKSKRPSKFKTSTSTTLNSRALEKKAGKSLGSILEDVTGVSTLQSGPNVQKPLIHGLYGNRILLVNHGVGLMAQQWGQDHAPEIDPFTAGKITVLKGAAAVKYGSSASGGVVLIDPAPLPTDHHLHGNTYLNVESNGRGVSSSVMLNSAIESIPGLAWRLQLSGRYFGDYQAADYNLTNTGSREGNFSFTTGYKTKKHKTTFYLSRFSTEVGILRGSHIGNLTDLEDAIQREEPLFTKSFSYDINAPKQQTSHLMIKGYHSRRLSKALKLELTYARQINDRKEFDVRRDKQDIPALDINLKSHYLRTEIEHKKLFKHLKGEIGSEYMFQNNTNSEEIGVDPFVPNFTREDIGIYAVERWTAEKWSAEFGARYSDQIVNGKTRDGASIIEHKFTQDGLALNLGFQLAPNDKFSYKVNFGTNVRPPAINERFSKGLHHGAARIEEGQLNLNAERSGKLVQSVSYTESDKFLIDLVSYVHSFEDYIYLVPDSVPRLTIRGAFPVFQYKQTDALIWGVDVFAKVKLWNNYYWSSSFSTVVGEDSDGNYLNNMPSDRWENAISYKKDSVGSWREFEFQIKTQKVWQLDRANEVVDILGPPEGYFITNFEVSGRRPFGKNELVIQAAVTNLFNESYREYLNGMRYYSNELGRNVQIRFKVLF